MPSCTMIYDIQPLVLLVCRSGGGSLGNRDTTFAALSPARPLPRLVLSPHRMPQTTDQPLRGLRQWACTGQATP